MSPTPAEGEVYLSVVAAAYNEAENLPGLVRKAFAATEDEQGLRAMA